MSHFALLWKARAIERYRRNYENEKMHSIMLSNAKLPKRSFIQRIRHLRYNCKKRVKRLFRMCCPKGGVLANFFIYLKTDQTFPNFILKSILGFMGGFVLTYMFFMFFVFQLSISLTHATVMCSVIGVLLTLGLAFSYRVRCLVFLLIPQFFSEVGRYTLMGYALILILTGPAKNTLHNSEVLSESMACGQEQLKAGVRQIQESITKPFNSMKQTIRLMVDSVKEVAAKIKETLTSINRMVLSIVRVIQSAFSWLSSVVSMCNKKMGTPSQRCHTALEEGVLDCRARLGPYFAWLCSVAYVGKVACHAAQVLDMMCVLVDFVSGTVVATIKRKLRTFSNHVKTMLFVSVHVHHSYSFSSNSSRSASQVAAGIVTEIRHRADRLLQWFSWMSCITSLFLLLIIFRAKYYQYMYETRSRYDNRYVTRELRELDLRRARESRDTVLPLNRRERAKYVTTTSFRLVASERLSIARSAIFLSITTFKLLIHMAADYSLYWVLITIRYHGRFETPPQPAAPDGGVLVSGVGPLAAMLRGLVSALAAPLAARPVLAPVSCLPDPSPPDTQRYMQIGILIVLLWTFAIFEPYGLRLRHAVMAHYRPERARARAVWLYNHILRSRGGFLKIARRKLHRNYKLQPHDKYTFRQWLDSVIPCWWLRSLLGTSGRGVRCLLCSVAERPDEPDSKLVKCETAGCVGVYCVSCFNDIGRLCTICLSPVDYGDVSDISLEKGSTEESDSADTNTTDMESAVGDDDFEKAPEWHSTDDEDDEDSSPRQTRQKITEKLVKFIRRNREQDKHSSSDYSQEGNTIWGKVFKRKPKKKDRFDEERELLIEERKKLMEEEEMLVKEDIIKRRDHKRELDNKKIIKKPLEIPKLPLFEGADGEKAKKMTDKKELPAVTEIGPKEGKIEDINAPITVAGIDTEEIVKVREKLISEMEEKQEKKKRKKKKGKTMIGEELEDVGDQGKDVEEKRGDVEGIKPEGAETAEKDTKTETTSLGPEKINVANAKVYYCWNKNKLKNITCVNSNYSGEIHTDSDISSDEDSSSERDSNEYVNSNGPSYNYAERNTLADCVCCNNNSKSCNKKECFCDKCNNALLNIKRCLKCHPSDTFVQKEKFDRQRYDSENIKAKYKKCTDRGKAVEIPCPKRGITCHSRNNRKDSFICNDRGRNIKIPCPMKKKDLDDECLEKIKEMVIAELNKEGEIMNFHPKRRFGFKRKGTKHCKEPYWKEGSSKIGPCGDISNEFKSCDCACHKQECHKNITSNDANKKSTEKCGHFESHFTEKTDRKKELSENDSTYLIRKERDKYMIEHENKGMKKKRKDKKNIHERCQCCLPKDSTEDCSTKTSKTRSLLSMKKQLQMICCSKSKICKIKVKDQEIQTDIELTDIEFAAVCQKERKKEKWRHSKEKYQNKENKRNENKYEEKKKYIIFRDEWCQKEEYKTDVCLETLPICEYQEIEKANIRKGISTRQNEIKCDKVIGGRKSCLQTKVIKPKKRILCFRRKTKKKDACVPCNNRKFSGSLKVIVFNKKPKMCIVKKPIQKNIFSKCGSDRLARTMDFVGYPEPNESVSSCCSSDVENSLKFYKAPVYKSRRIPSKKSMVFNIPKTKSSFAFKSKNLYHPTKYTKCQNRIPKPYQSDSNFDIDACECPKKFQSDDLRRAEGYQLCGQCSQKSIKDLCESVQKFTGAVCKNEKMKRKLKCRNIFRKRNRRRTVCISYMSSTNRYEVYRSNTGKKRRAPPSKNKTLETNRHARDKTWYSDIYNKEMGFELQDEVGAIHKLAIAYDQLMEQSDTNKYEKKYTSHPRAPKHAQGPWVEGYEWPADLATPRCLCPQEICTCGLRKPPEEDNDYDQFELRTRRRPRSRHGLIKMRERFPKKLLSLCKRRKKVDTLAGRGNLLPKLEKALAIEQGKYEEMTKRGDPLDTMPTDCLARCHKYYDKVTKHIVDDIALDYKYQEEPDEMHRKRNEQRLQEMIKEKEMGKKLAERRGLSGKMLRHRDEASLQDLTDGLCSDGRTPIGWTHTMVSPEDSSSDDGVDITITPVCSDTEKCKKAYLHYPQHRKGEVQFVLNHSSTESLERLPQNKPSSSFKSISYNGKADHVNIEVIDPLGRTSSLSETKWAGLDNVKTGAVSVVKNLQKCASSILRWTNWLEPSEPDVAGIDITDKSSPASQMARSIMGFDPMVQGRGPRRPGDEVKLNIELEGMQGVRYLCRPLEDVTHVIDAQTSALNSAKKGDSLIVAMNRKENAKSDKSRTKSAKSDKKLKTSVKSNKNHKESVKFDKERRDPDKSNEESRESVKYPKKVSVKSEKNTKQSDEEHRESFKSDKKLKTSVKPEKNTKERIESVKSDEEGRESVKSDRKRIERIIPVICQKGIKSTSKTRKESFMENKVSVKKVEKASSPITIKSAHPPAVPVAVSVPRMDRATGASAVLPTVGAAVHPWGDSPVWEQPAKYTRPATEAWRYARRARESDDSTPPACEERGRGERDAQATASPTNTCNMNTCADYKKVPIITPKGRTCDCNEDQLTERRYKDRRGYLLDRNAGGNDHKKNTPIESQALFQKKTLLDRDNIINKPTDTMTEKKYLPKKYDQPGSNQMDPCIRRRLDRRDYLMESSQQTNKKNTSAQQKPSQIYNTSFSQAHRICKDCAQKARQGQKKNICIQCKSCELLEKIVLQNAGTSTNHPRCELLERNKRSSKNSPLILKKSMQYQKRRYIPHNTDTPAKCMCRDCCNKRNLFKINLESSPQCSYIPRRTVRIGTDTSRTSKSPENLHWDHRVKERVVTPRKYQRSVSMRDEKTQSSDVSLRRLEDFQSSDECVSQSDENRKRRRSPKMINRKMAIWKRNIPPAWCKDHHDRRRWRHIDRIIPSSEHGNVMSLFRFKEIPRSSHSTSLESEMRITSLDIAERGTSVGENSLAAKKSWFQKFRQNFDSAGRDVTDSRKCDVNNRGDRRNGNPHGNVIVMQECETTPLCSKRTYARRKIDLAKEQENKELNEDRRITVDAKVETRLSMPTDGGVVFEGKFFKTPTPPVNHANQSAMPPSECMSPKSFTIMSSSQKEQDVSWLRDYQYKFEPVKTSSPAEDAAKLKNVILSKDASPILLNHNCGFFEMMHHSLTPKRLADDRNDRRNQRNETSDAKLKTNKAGGDAVLDSSLLGSMVSEAYSMSPEDGAAAWSVRASQIHLSDVEAMGQKSSTESQQGTARKNGVASPNQSKDKLNDKSMKISPKKLRGRRRWKNLDKAFIYTFFKKKVSGLVKAGPASVSGGKSFS